MKVCFLQGCTIALDTLFLTLKSIEGDLKPKKCNRFQKCLVDIIGGGIMCEICEEICKGIADIFGHEVNPNKLAKLIENSPLVE